MKITTENAKTWLIAVVLFGFALLLLLFSLYLCTVGWPADGEQLGQLGDFLGGILNPIFSLLALVGVLVTVILQTEEVKLAREDYHLARELGEQQAKMTADISRKEELAPILDRWEKTLADRASQQLIYLQQGAVPTALVPLSTKLSKDDAVWINKGYKPDTLRILDGLRDDFISYFKYVAEYAQLSCLNVTDLADRKKRFRQFVHTLNLVKELPLEIQEFYKDSV